MANILSLLMTIILILSGCDIAPVDNAEEQDSTSIDTVQEHKGSSEDVSNDTAETHASEPITYPSVEDLPSIGTYSVLNNNVPQFSNDDLTATEPYATFSPFDSLGRTGPAQGLLHESLMPAQDRGSISHIYPTGWNQGKYDHIDNGGWLYNRSHLIGYQLTGNDAPQNILSGTRQFNVDSMLPFENYVANYVEETADPVLYRVTPIYQNNNLLAHGVQMEGYSPQDDGDSIQFNIFVPNVQDGVEINYATGEHALE